jgi:hypothetical protein
MATSMLCGTERDAVTIRLPVVFSVDAQGESLRKSGHEPRQPAPSCVSEGRGAVPVDDQGVSVCGSASRLSMVEQDLLEQDLTCLSLRISSAYVGSAIIWVYEVSAAAS